MATFAIGDIHGNEATLADLLGQLEPLIRPEDTVVFVGERQSEKMLVWGTYRFHE